ncbi:MAG: helix-turn-helix domain-containing protein [Phycisphaerae bacterium]|jgi:AraC-like DNA-binding protein
MSNYNVTKIKPAERHYLVKKDDPLHGILSSVAVGFDEIEPGCKISCPKPYLDSLAVEMTISGHAVNYYPTGKALHSPGSLLAMFPELSFYEVAQNDVWNPCWFVLWGPLADKFVLELAKNAVALSMEPVPGNIRFDMFEVCRMILQQPAGWVWKWNSHLFSVLNYIRYTIISYSHTSSLIAKAREIMDNNKSSPISLTEIADILNVSLSTLSHTFRTETGISPAKVYKQIRIDKAKQLLVNGLSVQETSQQLGFENPFHFSKLFKQLEQIPPSQYQEQNQKPSLRTKIL